MLEVTETVGTVTQLADLVTVDLTSLLLPPITFAIWRIQVRRDRRDRTLDFYRMYESETMKGDRHDAWRYLQGGTGPIVPLVELMDDPDSARLNAYGACYGVLTFFATIHSLLRTRHLDARLVNELFESSRASWAEAFRTSGIDAASDNFIGAPLNLIFKPFSETWRKARWRIRRSETKPDDSPSVSAPHPKPLRTQASLEPPE